jgi:hypothetical protein
MVDKKDLGVVSYVIGLVSIVLAFFQPLAGLVLGIIGLVQSKKVGKGAAQAKKLNIIGIVIGILMLIISVSLSLYLAQQGAFNGLGNLPLQ